MIATADLLIVGGGLHGCSAALNAAIRGLSVIVLEKDTVGRHASGVNGGGVRRLGRHLAEIPISNRSMEIWRRINELVDDDCGFQPAPQIRVIEHEQDLEAQSQRSAEVRALGFYHEVMLDQQELRSYLPAVAPHCVGALASLDDGFALPFRTTFAFKRKAQQLGVQFYEETIALTITREGQGWKVSCAGGQSFSGRYLLNSAGAWAGEFARQAGDKAPVEAVAPMMLVTQRMPHFCDAVVGAAGRPLSFKQMPNGTVVVGGGTRGKAFPESNITEMSFNELRRSAQTAIDIFPIMSKANVVRSWSGIEALMPDRVPVIGPSSREENLFHAFGFSEHGFQMAPAVGEIMAELIANGTTDAAIEPFSIARFG
ncbi:FAD-dependent oxidoreductase [Metarhizobium album]|uniref:FAD-dependent oxidoreductase n=1 Tax=Metarhizobium album TaxID=2182425 RepID=A0A2U2DK91_9HYPH|nr:FAD-dependent oxidoreductase [Rhizobium album]PWE53718.1 FAD-dependent oxidoreductase [Rhizobium album]